MALIDLNLQPGSRDLRWFGVIVLVMFAMIGGLVYWRTGALRLPAILWGIGGGLCLLYYAIEPLRVPLFRVWMLLLFPIGWTVSHLVLGLIYLLLFAPIGLVMRLFGRDPMQRRWRPEAESYWIDRKRPSDLKGYFRQF